VTDPATKLGKRLAAGAVTSAAPAASAVSGSRLSQLVLSGRRGETVELPLIGTARIEMLGCRDAEEVELEVDHAMRAAGVELTPLTAGRFELQRARRTLARAAIDPADGKPIGTLEEWERVDVTTLNACWLIHDDVVERLDPLRRPVSVDELLAIDAAVKKKDARLLRSFGLLKLCVWLTSTDAPPSTSPNPSSASSDTQSDS
jgi:hypothetical protein